MNTSIIICGQKFDIGTRVVLWNEPGGLNGYDESVVKTQDRNTGKITTVSGKRYGKRSLLKPNPTLDQLKKIITQMVFHHTGNLTASSTQETLHERNLSVTFILGDDGVLFQTLDIKEKSWHAGTNNPMSIGIEICSRADAKKFPTAYDEYHQQKYNVLPREKRYDKTQGMMIWGYEYNSNQYKTLIKLAYAISQIFPNLETADFPRTANRRVITSIIPKPLDYIGFLGHYNVSIQKWDPVCFDHQRLLNGITDGGEDGGSTFLTFDTVKIKQSALAKLGYKIDVDGDWGPQSAQTLKDFQKDNGLKADGEWGPMVDYMMDVALKAKGL